LVINRWINKEKGDKERDGKKIKVPSVVKTHAIMRWLKSNFLIRLQNADDNSESDVYLMMINHHHDSNNNNEMMAHK
jgi:hypothetical protein